MNEAVPVSYQGTDILSQLTRQNAGKQPDSFLTAMDYQLHYRQSATDLAVDIVDIREQPSQNRSGDHCQRHSAGASCIATYDKSGKESCCTMRFPRHASTLFPSCLCCILRKQW